MQAQHALRIFGSRGDLHDRDAGGVRRQHRVGISNDAVQVGEDLSLDRLVLDDCFDDQLPVGQVIEVRGEGQLAQCALTLTLGYLARTDATLQ